MAVLWISLLLAINQAFAFTVETQDTNEPEYLDSLLKNKNYEEFARLMGIENVDLVKPGPENKDPMFNKGLSFGDILLTPDQAEQARQGMNFDRYPGNKWTGGFVPFTISSDFTRTNRDRILQAIQVWNQQVDCIEWRPRSNERDYVNFFPGNGCYSYLGRTGRSQALSLQQNGCFRQGTILHEMDHAIGFAHEHNRSDRDTYMNVLWDNIPEEWHSQYQKTNTRDYGLQGDYDYYSVMHYGMNAPGTNKKAFEVRKPGVNERNIGQRNGFTQADLDKIAKQYC